ncbi:alpha-L-arabinofuranosidase C-terminal domain-containing protein [Paenibacillus sacheonensis]|uniref:non-reducing end alpha-L-arabinofuranosidase n=1 Tax=Paenibacillus sacheonensis TaxID=742054 RepID=A0A7X4YSQ8_9BACL|nr:alpha-L-arabinofuranosidase C-terminal domain-containing protein [Paenibacillus sacheonensis]MBM7568121.1 alpha-N-arabinofuranosidase [Paenibacillus sacheonensis]NBC71877.1 alpha-L-arabinofuranosidase [Paenibacillus sacheonensis]
MSQRATITVHTDAPSKHRLNPYIFGHFVEDIRDHMDAMLAFALKDMDFEDEADARGVSSGWHAVTNGKNTEYALEPAAPRHSGHSQRIRIFSADRCYGGIGQRVSVEGGVPYRVTIVARAAMDLRAAVCELVDRESGERLDRAELQLRGHRWGEYELELTPARSCERAEFRILLSSEEETWRDGMGSGMLWLDHASMLPSTSMGYVKREVVELTRRLKPGMMRIAGNYISAYHFEDAIGPVLERPNMINEAWGGWTNKYFGTDEFLQFCRDTDTEPLICVNAGTGTPEEAAAWLEYCNGGVDTKYGALRARNGHPEPYGVRYWEIGNEIYGSWQHGHCTAEQFAHRYNRFADAMKAVDSDIVLLACGDCDPEWNKTVLGISAEKMDMLTLHIYHGFGTVGILPGTPKEERYPAVMSFPEISRAVIRMTEEIITGNPAYSHVKLAITEYNTMYYPNTIREGRPMEHTLEAAVANAANLNEFIRQSHLIEIGSYSDLVNGWLGGCIRVGDGYADQYRGKEAGWSERSRVVYGTPTFHVMEAYANRSIFSVLPACTDCATFDWPSGSKRFDLAPGPLPVLDVTAALDESGHKLTLFVVNRGLAPVEAELAIGSFVGAGNAKVWELTGDDYETINDVFHPEAVIVRERQLEFGSSQPVLAMKPHSVSIVEVSK